MIQHTCTERHKDHYQASSWTCNHTDAHRQSNTCIEYRQCTTAAPEYLRKYQLHLQPYKASPSLQSNVIDRQPLCEQCVEFCRSSARNRKSIGTFFFSDEMLAQGTTEIDEIFFSSKWLRSPKNRIYVLFFTPRHHHHPHPHDHPHEWPPKLLSSPWKAIRHRGPRRHCSQYLDSESTFSSSYWMLTTLSDASSKHIKRSPQVLKWIKF